MAGTLFLTALAGVMVGIFHPLPGPTASAEGGDDGGDDPAADGSGPTGPARRNAFAWTRSAGGRRLPAQRGARQR